MLGLVDFFLIVFFGGIYFLPTYLAKVNQHSNVLGVAVLNIFLGWTIIGWAISFLWAMEKYSEKDLAK